VRTAHNVKEQVHVALVQTSDPVQHDDFSVGPVGAVEQVFFKRFLLFNCREYIVVVVFSQYAIAVVVQNGHTFDGV